MKNAKGRMLIGMIAALVALIASFVLLAYLYCYRRENNAASVMQQLSYNQSVIIAGALILVFLVLTVVVVYSGYRLYVRTRNSYDELNLFNDELPVVVFKGRADDNLTLLYVSSGFKTLTGYSVEEFKKKFNNHFVELLHPDDRERIVHSHKYKSATTSLVMQQRFRIVKKDGSVVWASVDCRCIKVDGVEHILGVMLDVSERVRSEREIAISREKFRIALQHTPNIYLEYLHDGNVLINTDPKAAFLGLPQRISNVPEAIIASGYIFPESVDALRNMYSRINAGEEYASSEVHIKTSAMDSDVWLHADMTNIFTPDGDAAQAIVLIRDITKEKVAERDVLTALYNRATGEALMRNILAENTENRHAFLMFDVDNFKAINDTYGHYAGDGVLSAFAKVLRGCFRESDVIYRLGGDEFVVFLRNIHAYKLALKRAAEVISTSQEIELNGEKGNVSASCGIALCPRDGSDVSTLYKKADEVLYRAKHAGRGRFELYGEPLTDEEQ